MEAVAPSSQAAVAGGHSRLEVFQHHRALLFSIAYRMLGSVADAEDMLQEAFIRWQQTTGAEIQSPRAFLVTIISRLCINHLQSARVHREAYFGQWLPEPLLTNPADTPSATARFDESLSMAFLMLLERLTPMERAVFLLREVFDYEYSEIAQIVGQNESNCRQILRRARQHVTQGRPRFDPSPQQCEKLLQQFRETTSRGDMEGLLALLSSDIVLYADGGGKATAVPNPIYGPDRVARFLFGARRKFMPDRVVTRVVQMNGQPGIVAYLDGRPFGALTIDVMGGRIFNIYIVRNPDKLERLPILPPLPS
jgi:RNA polymerase sigma-70 factor, ECF subfamily